MVVRTGSFDGAAKALNVTPSAISQRVKALEERLGTVLIARGTPCVATDTGALLCRHVEHVGLLEKSLAAQLPGVVDPAEPTQRVTLDVGASVIAAHHALVKELLKLAGNDSPLAGLGSHQVGSDEGGLCKLDEPERREGYASILGRAGRNEVSVEASALPPLETMHWSMHSHSAMFAEVRVNTVTGEPRVSRLLGSFDCGRILNPKTAASQFRGGIIMGLGLALMEETQHDPRTGRIANPSLSDYHVPVQMDVPEIEVMWTDIPDPRAPMGARGVGEIGITGTAAAIANAVYNATGKRVRDLPITLDKLL